MTTAALPTGSSINPATGEGEFSEPGSQTLFVLFKIGDGRTRPTRVLSGYGQGGVYAGWEVGTVHELHHDQTGARLGTYRVVGIALADGTKIGDVPDRKIKHSVFK